MGKLRVFKSFALDLASLSKCTERSVAAIITSGDLSQVHSIGINGGAHKQHDCMCVTEGKYGCIHAEINCLVKNRYHGQDKIMIVTLAPCKQCAAAIINTPGGFSRIYYVEKWKGTEGLAMLNTAGIEVVQL